MEKAIIYSTPNCHFCKDAKEFMTKNGVEYDEINVADPQNVSQKELMIEMTGQMGVPVIRVGDDVFVGFDESKMKEVLGL